MVDSIRDTRNEEGKESSRCTSSEHSKCITLAYRLGEKEVETLGISSLRERLKLFKTLSCLRCQQRQSSRNFATHWPKCKAEVLVDKLADRLEKKSFEPLSN